MLHQVGVVRKSGRFQASKHALWGAMLQSGLVHDPYGLSATMPRLRVRAEHNRIPGLNGHDALEQDRGGGVRDRRQREEDSDWFGHLHQIALGKVADDAHSTFVFDVVVDKLTGHHILDDLVFHYSELGFFNGQAGEVLCLFQSGEDHRFDDAVDVLLIELGEDCSGGPGLMDQSVEISYAFRTEAFWVKRDLYPLLTFFACDHCCLRCALSLSPVQARFALTLSFYA